MNTAEHYLSIQNEMGETPIWEPEENRLYWVDAAQHVIYRCDIATGQYESFQPDLPVRALCRRIGNRWLVVTDHGLAFWDSNTPDRCEFLVDPYAEQPDLQFNDGAIDRQGRLVVGSFNHTTLDAPDGALYRFDSDRSLHTLDSQLILSNGIGFSPDGKTVYVVEMFAHTITAYDYTPDTGQVANRREFVRIPEEIGMPDGLTVDSEGGVWVAHWGGWRVSRYDPDGTLERQIQVPTEIVTCIGFGGARMNELYITTAWWSLNEQQRKEQPLAGDLFRIETDVQGLVETPFSG